MPTYEYLCRKCGDQFEAFQSISAPPLKRCPKCKGAVARVLTTGSGIIFKGSGFYQTDYKKSSHASTATDSGDSKKSEVAKPDSGKPDSVKKDSGKSEKTAK